MGGAIHVGELRESELVFAESTLKRRKEEDRIARADGDPTLSGDLKWRDPWIKEASVEVGVAQRPARNPEFRGERERVKGLKITLPPPSLNSRLVLVK